MEFRVLGSLEVLADGGTSIDLGGPQARSLLVMLLIAGDRVVPADTIIERVWTGQPPPSANSTLQSYISRLRRALDASADGGDSARRLTWEARGYRLRVPDDEVDARLFERLADEGRELLERGDTGAAHATLTEALDLWRDDALAEFADLSWARGIATRLDERRLAAIEERIRADLLLGRHELVVGELADLVDQHRLREGLWEQFAIALYRSGRQADALRAIGDLRHHLVDELGVDLSPRLRALEMHILDQDASLDPPASSSRTPIDRDEHAPDAQTRISRHFEGTIPTEVIGRANERAALEDAVESTLRGRTQWVLLEGEPGIGKTRLLEDLASRAYDRGFDVLWGRSFEFGSTPAFWPWLGAIRGLAEKVKNIPGQPSELVQRLLNAELEDEFIPPVDANRFHLFAAIADVFEVAARIQPVVIALDDLQWADPASLELIEFLTGHIIGSPILFAATVRELELGRNDAVTNALGHISRRPLTRRVRLSGLTLDEAAALVRTTAISASSDELIEAIHQRSEGNPFFIGELTRLLATDEHLTPAELVRRAGVPAGVRDVVHQRLGWLPAATAELVQLAAVIGRDCHLGLLSRAAGMPIDACIDNLDPALVHRLMIDVPQDPGTIRFSHALVREVVLDDLSVLRRSRLHLRAADAIESIGRAEGDDAETIAEHLWQAASLGVEVRAAEALERASEVALRRFAYEAADSLLERALRLRHDLAPDRADPNAELDAINRLTIVRGARFGYQQTLWNTPIERAKELARQTGRDLVLAELLWMDWAASATSCDFNRSERIAAELLALGSSSGDPLVRATGVASWGIHCWHVGRVREAVEHTDEALAALDASTQTDPTSFGLIRQHHLLTRGFNAVYRELAGCPFPDGSPLPAHAGRQGNPYGEVLLWVCEALRGLVADDAAASTLAATRAREADATTNFRFFSSGAVVLQGCATARYVDPAEGVATIERGLKAYEANGVRTIIPFYLSIQSEGWLAAADIDQAKRSLARAEAVLDQTGERWQQPFVMAAAASVHAAEGNVAEAAMVLREAHGVATAQGALGTAERVLERAASLGVDV